VVVEIIPDHLFFFLMSNCNPFFRVSDVVLQPEVYCGGLLSLANILQSQLTRHFSLVLLSTCLWTLRAYMENLGTKEMPIFLMACCT
jgi:hypothetical protein